MEVGYARESHGRTQQAYSGTPISRLRGEIATALDGAGHAAHFADRDARVQAHQPLVRRLRVATESKLREPNVRADEMAVTRVAPISRAAASSASARTGCPLGVPPGRECLRVRVYTASN